MPIKTTAASAAVVLTYQTGAITMSKLTNYFRETSEEMRYKVTWPSLEELQKSAGLVLIGSLLFAAVVGLMDVIFNKGLDAFYNSFR
ncbi:preprotein translocase subunit SecE [Hymenobacter luteus]|uniref:Protein translocase subunit SecE n=2 Tax=Hymenobacter TaxID=89966 RepID=A0A7W9W9J4_9BACT|nr:preprotein translocase subunit SecE [Hymenobacter latericoloratus]MBB4599976.1 preprotein translocase subunit SecE [Hymenobacter latericoloratus]MBB6057714.1 preprotein translocase subunit SecE [Hymenobacter luteus]